MTGAAALYSPFRRRTAGVKSCMMAARASADDDHAPSRSPPSASPRGRLRRGWRRPSASRSRPRDGSAARADRRARSSTRSPATTPSGVLVCGALDPGDVRHARALPRRWCAPAIRSSTGRPASPSCCRCGSAAQLVQGVHLTDAAGVLWLATYRLERQPDGGWRDRRLRRRARGRQDGLSRGAATVTFLAVDIGNTRLKWALYDAADAGRGDAGARRRLPRGDRRSRRRRVARPADAVEHARQHTSPAKACAGAPRRSSRSGTSSRAGS